MYWYLLMVIKPSGGSNKVSIKQTPEENCGIRARFVDSLPEADVRMEREEPDTLLC